MSYTFQELKKKRVNELREIAAGMEEESVKGFTQMNKEHLLAAICEALGLEMHDHHEVVGIDKAAIKSQIRLFKKQRDEAIAKKKPDELIKVRRKIRQLKKELRKATI